MLSKSLYEIREKLQDQGIVFCYSGYMTESVLSGIGQVLKQKLALEEMSAGTTRKIFGIFVEQMQNIIRYSAEREPPCTEESVLSYGLLTVGQEENLYFVACGNKILKGDVGRLNTQLRAIQGMDQKELKALYKQILLGDIPEGSKGAGVGFVDIAKKASRPIEFDFLDIGSEHDFFTLKAYI
ncbi:MAG: hypothetical protein HQL52_08035 [Magnetococcales bacterium]|nr:hypothetical protein [Magnetococcales bacterium]